MATTARPRIDIAAPQGRLPTLTWLAAAVLLLMTPAAQADRWAVDAGVSSMLTWSSNAELGIGANDAQADTILNIRPRVTLRGDGARLKVSGTVALDAVAYANDTQPNRVLPEVDLSGRLEAVQRFFFIDAGVRASRTRQDLFGVSNGDTGSVNTITTGQANLSPSIESSFNETTRYRIRSDNSWTRDLGDETTQTASAAGYFGNHLVLIEHDPRPFGWRAELSRSETRYRDGSDEPLITDIGRLTADYALGEAFSAGLRIGREHTLRTGIESWNRIYGWQARWQPNMRTSLAAFQEKRSFGSSWNLRFDHRSPQIAWGLISSRQLDTTPQSALNLPAGANVAGMLDAIFTTRFPDPVERAGVVADFMATYNVPGSTQQPISVFAQRLSISTSNTATVTLIGSRSALTLSAFGVRTEDAPDSGLTLLGAAITNNTQRGASVALSHRLSPTLSFNTSADWSRIRALEAVDETTQSSVRAQLALQLSPKTSAMTGVRYRAIRSNVTPEGREGSFFVGLDHRM